MIPLSTANVDISVNSPILSLNPEYIDHQALCWPGSASVQLLWDEAASA